MLAASGEEATNQTRTVKYFNKTDHIPVWAAKERSGGGALHLRHGRVLVVANLQDQGLTCLAKFL
jgi:hypothetical protein